MTIDEAIDVLNEHLGICIPLEERTERAALQLSIEALKRVQAYKKAHIGLHYEPMPGETE